MIYTINTADTLSAIYAFAAVRPGFSSPTQTLCADRDLTLAVHCNGISTAQIESRPGDC